MHDPASVQPYDIPTVLYISNTITHYTTIKNVKKRTVTVTKTKTQKQDKKMMMMIDMTALQ
jgi:hypothetical protein